jgi:serine palmitoyltransferase
MITASIGNSIGSIGGFACGDEIACSHQRLNSSSYVFSCSLPPFSASAASKAFELIEKGVELSRLQKNVTVLHDGAQHFASCLLLFKSNLK